MYGSSNITKKVVKKNTEKKQQKNGEISESNMKKLKEVSKNFKGGMNSKHMKNMVKFMKSGDTFSMAHKKAVKLDSKK